MENALYIINLIETNLNARQGVATEWTASKFDDVVKATNANRPRPRTFGQRRNDLLQFADEPFFAFAYSIIDGDLMQSRNHYAHEYRQTPHNVKQADVDKLRALASAETGKDFSTLPVFIAIEKAFYKRIDAKHGKQVYNAQTFGQRLVELYRAGVIDKKTAKRYWTVNELRNEITHTGRTLTEKEKQLLKSYQKY